MENVVQKERKIHISSVHIAELNSKLVNHKVSIKGVDFSIPFIFNSIRLFKMNVTILNKLERGWIRMNWKSAIRRNKLSSEQLEALVDKVDNFKSNRSAKEIILYKYKVLPIYVTIYREEYPQLLEYLLSRFVEIERYEVCSRIVKLQNKLKKYAYFNHT